jgi:YVTN family beta-propeller protein
MSRLVRIVMRVLATLIAVIVLAIIAFSVYLSARPSGKTVRAAGTISVPSPFRIRRPCIDYMLVAGPRLYTGYASDGMVGVVDTGDNKVVATITGMGRVHGVAIVADRNLGFASSSGDNNVYVFDLATNKVLKAIPGGDEPDAIIYDQKDRLIYVGNHNGKSATLIDPVSQTVLGAIPLGGEPEYSQADPDSGLIYQNLEDTSELVVIDPQKQAVVKRYKIAPGEGPTGLALDAANHRLFCTAGNRRMIVLDANKGTVVAVLPIGAGVDGAGYDPALHRVYTANGLGTMTVIQQDSPDQYHVIEDAPTHFGGHSLVVDLNTHRIYVAYFGNVAMYDVTP